MAKLSKTPAKSGFPGIARQGGKQTESALVENIELLTGQRGNGENRALLYKDLVNLDEMKLNALRNSAKGNTNGGGLPINVGGVERPHKPVNLSGVGGFTFIALTWDHPTYRGHAYAEIWRSETDSFSSAALIATEVTDIFSDSVNMGAEYYYWVRFVNIADMRGPIQGAAGLKVATQESAEAILDKIGGQIEESHLGHFLSTSIGNIDDILGDLDESALAIIENALAGDLESERKDRVNAIIFEQQTTFASDILATARKTELLLTQVGSNIALLLEDYSTTSDMNQAISTATTTLRSQIEDEDGNSVGASLQQLSQTVATNDGKFTALWGVKTEVNGVTSSIGLVNDGEDPMFVVKGAKFAVITDQDPTNFTPVFAIVDGKTVISSAVIDEAYIQQLVTDDLLSNRVIVGAQLSTPSINYDPETGARSNNFSIDPNGNLYAYSATLQGVTILDPDGNVIMSSTGQLSVDIDVDDLNLGEFAGLDKILKSNVTTYIESGAIGTAQIDQAYIETLFGEDASFYGTVYAKNLEGDVTDLKTKTSTNVTATDSGTEVTIVSFTIASLPFDRNVTLSAIKIIGSHGFSNAPDCLVSLYVSGSSTAADTHSHKFGNDTGTTTAVTKPLAAEIPANTTKTVTLKLKITSNEGSQTVNAPAQTVICQTFKDGSTIS